jgi:hypothetical protein
MTICITKSCNGFRVIILIQILHEIPVNCRNATFQSWGKQVTATYICIVWVRLAMQCTLYAEL